MSPLPDYRPKQLSVGPLESEILQIIWKLGEVTVKDVHDCILNDPSRELAYASVTTVLRRLTEKGWLVCNKTVCKNYGVHLSENFLWVALQDKPSQVQSAMGTRDPFF